MPKFDIETEILINRRVAKDHFLIHCRAEEIAKNALPGQFVHVLIPSEIGILLRRPFTIYSCENDEITMIYQIIGKGTEILSRRRSGDRISILGPLGNSFDLSIKPDPAIVVGGGAGIASLMLLANVVATAKIPLIVFVGAMNRDRLLSVDDLKKIDLETHVSTDDGSFGKHGFVTELLIDHLDQRDLKFNHKTRPIVFACGPNAMLKAVAKICADRGVACQVALENRMGCAMGVCLGCVRKIQIDDENFEFQRVCTEGPIFDASKVIWD